MGAMKKSTFTREYATLCETIAKLRTDAGLTQRQLAERLGVAHSWVAKVEAGERRLDVVEFCWLVAACGGQLTDAFGRFVRSASLDETRTKGRKR
jgi:transcriptional regulator with XRE-family HTH domain